MFVSASAIDAEALQKKFGRSQPQPRPCLPGLSLLALHCLSVFVWLGPCSLPDLYL